QSLHAGVRAQLPRVFPSLAKVLAILPEPAEFSRDLRPVDLLLFSELVCHAFAHELGNGLAFLAAHRGKDSGNVVIQVQLGSFHSDVYFTSRIEEQSVWARGSAPPNLVRSHMT